MIYSNRPKIRIFNKKNIENFKSKAKATNDVIDNETENDSNLLWKKFISMIKNDFEICFPEVTMSRSKIKSKPWFTKAIKKSSVNKRKLYLKWLKNKTPTNESQYKRYRNLYNTMIKKAKEMYEKGQFEQDKSNKCLWSHINKLYGNNAGKDHISQIKVDDTYIKTNKSIADHMNKYFSEIGSKLAEQITKDSSDCFENHMPPNLNNDILLTKTSKLEIENIINGFQNKCSASHDMISMLVLVKRISLLEFGAIWFSKQSE